VQCVPCLEAGGDVAPTTAKDLDLPIADDIDWS
jgi:hypothetical protein